MSGNRGQASQKHQQGRLGLGLGREIREHGVEASSRSESRAPSPIGFASWCEQVRVRARVGLRVRELPGGEIRGWDSGSGQS